MDQDLLINDRSVKRLTREFIALVEISKVLTSTDEIQGMLDSIMKKIIGVLEPAELGVIMLWESSSGLFRPAAAFGYEIETLKMIGLREGESITGKVFDSGEVCLLRTQKDVALAMTDMREANRAVMINSLGSDTLPLSSIAAPITVDERKYGVIVLETLNGPSGFDDEDIPFVKTLADLIALAIDRSRLEAKADSVRDARQTDRLRSELMATLSHELRLPLTAIKGYTTALMLDDINWGEEKQNEFLQYIDEECDNMNVILTDILDSSIINIEELAMETEPIRIHHTAHDISTEMLRRTEIHNIIVDIPSDFPIVEADPNRIKQVFRNILDNAIKYSPDGGLIIIKGEARDQDVVITIADQGIGISPENLIPLFEKYSRGEFTSEPHISGMGLGLPIARTIVEAHNGRIWAESNVGRGTKMSFSLPIRKNTKPKAKKNS
jgi:K+-sensing histidine kinase KdpD